MGELDGVIQELARRRDTLARSIHVMAEWRRLRGDVFSTLLSARRSLANEQRAFLAAIADGHSVSRGFTAEILGSCRTLRSILAEVDATILNLIGS